MNNIMMLIQLAPLFFFGSSIYAESMEYDERIEIVSNLISLHEKHCGTVPLCAFKSLNTAYDSNECCMQCSCERDCFRKGACCPDYWVMEAKHLNLTDVVAYLDTIKTLETNHHSNGTISIVASKTENSSAKADAYVNVAKTLVRAHDVMINVTGRRNYRNSTNSSYLETVIHEDDNLMLVFESDDIVKKAEHDKNTACVTAQLRNIYLLDIYSALDLEYEMINACWVNDTDAELVDQCVNLTISNIMDVKRLIPVTSLDSFKTYRNIYCLQCNEGRHGNVIVWKTLQKSYMSKVTPKTVEPTKWWLTDSESFRNIVYEPPEHVKNYTSKCKRGRVDIDTCSELNTTNTELEIDKNLLKSICNRFYLPVYESKYKRYTTYANIACYLCHRPQLLSGACSKYDLSGTAYLLELDTERIHMYDTASNSTLNQSFSANCKNGFIYDGETASCRKVLCPRYLIIYDGMCTAYLLQTRNIFYTAFLKVKVNASEQYPNKADFYSNYVTYINAASEDTFGGNVVTVWKVENSSEISVLLVVKPNTEFYADSLGKFLTFIWKLSQYKIPGLSTFYPEVNIQDEDVVQSEEIKRELSKLNIFYPASQWTEKEFRLGNINFCPRIAMNSSETTTKVIGFRRRVLQLRSGKIVAPENVDVTNVTTGMNIDPNFSPIFLVCIKDVIPNRSLSYDSIIQYSKNLTLVTLKTKGTEFEPLFVIIVAVMLIAVVLLIAIPRGWKLYVARRRPTNDQQMSSPSHIDAQ